MCGRYSNAKSLKKLERRIRVVEQTGLFGPRFNIAPTQMAPVICLGKSGPGMKLMRWGLIPRWTKDPTAGPVLINARSETIETTPAFKQAFQSRRCLVPADGFYEWQERAGKRQPFRIVLATGEPFCLAGLWETWAGPSAAAEAAVQIIESFTIITTAASGAMIPLHQRMPVIIGPDDYLNWLEGEGLKTMPDGPASVALKIYPVSDLVNSPAHDDSRCIEPVAIERDLFEQKWWHDG